ncbi:unnamed protein product [Ixodes pacificus]
MTPRLEPAKGRQPAGAMAHDEPHHEPVRAASRNSTNLKRCVSGSRPALHPPGPEPTPQAGFPARETTWRRRPVDARRGSDPGRVRGVSEPGPTRPPAERAAKIGTRPRKAPTTDSGRLAPSRGRGTRPGRATVPGPGGVAAAGHPL